METERFLTGESQSTRAPIDGKGYIRAEDCKSSAVHVAGGVPFPTDTEAMDRKLARQEKMLMKERIHKLFYDEKGDPRVFPSLLAGILGIGSIMGFLYGIGRITDFIFFGKFDMPFVATGLLSLICLMFGLTVSVGIGMSILRAINGRTENKSK